MIKNPNVQNRYKALLSIESDLMSISKKLKQIKGTSCEEVEQIEEHIDAAFMALHALFSRSSTIVKARDVFWSSSIDNFDSSCPRCHTPKNHTSLFCPTCGEEL